MSARSPTRVGSSTFDPLSSELRSGEGGTTALRPQTAEVLAILLAHRGELVGKSDLIERVWPDTSVTDDSLVQCMSEIRKALGAKDARLLKTVPRKGYKLEADGGQPAGRRWPRRRARRAVLVAAAVLVLAAAAVWLWPAPGPQARPVVAVLPFENLGGDPEREYLSDGMAVDLITDLSGVSALTVISRTSSFAFKGKSLDLRQIARDLGATHVVEGSVQAVGDRLRIAVQLSDAATGTQIWAERFDRGMSQILTAQDELSGRVIAALKVRLTRSETDRLAHPLTSSDQAYDLYLRGQRQVSFFDAASNKRAQAYLESATRIDPGFASAYALLAQAYSLAIENGWNDAGPSEEAVARTLATARRAIELDPRLPYAYWSLGRILSRGYRGDTGGALDAYRKAIGFDPNYADGYIGLASTQIKLGRAETALPNIEKAMRLNPHSPYWYAFTLGQAQYFMANYEAAAESFGRSIEQNRNVSWPHRWLVATFGQLGRRDDADWEIGELEALGQPLTIETFRPLVAIEDEGYRARLLDGLRKAGVPES